MRPALCPANISLLSGLLLPGTRADHNRDRNFRGKLALVTVFDFALGDTDAACLFRSGDAALPDPSAGGGAEGSTGPCNPNPCQHAGTCGELFGHFTCTCQRGFQGPTCADIAPPPAPPPPPPPPPPGATQCSRIQLVIRDQCQSNCAGCDFTNANVVLGQCVERGSVAAEALRAQCAMTPALQPVTPRVEEYSVGAAGLQGWSTLRMIGTCNAAAGCANIYTIAGTVSTALQIPAGFQVAVPFGVDIGGTNPAFWAILPESQYDSWLTIGIDDGTRAGDISSIGIPFDGNFGWSEDRGIWTNNGALFYMDPSAGAVGDVLLGQVTVRPATRGAPTNVATMMLQGRSTAGAGDWSQNSVTFQL